MQEAAAPATARGSSGGYHPANGGQRSIWRPTKNEIRQLGKSSRQGDISLKNTTLDDGRPFHRGKEQRHIDRFVMHSTHGDDAPLARFSTLSKDSPANRGKEQRHVERTVLHSTLDDDTPLISLATLGEDMTTNGGIIQRHADRSIRHSTLEDDTSLSRFGTVVDDCPPNGGNEQRHFHRSIRHSSHEDDEPLTRFSTLDDDRGFNRGTKQEHIDRSLRHFTHQDDTPLTRFSTLGIEKRHDVRFLRHSTLEDDACLIRISTLCDARPLNRRNEQSQVNRSIRYSSDEDDVPFTRFSTPGDDWTPNRGKEQKYVDRSLRHSTLENDTPITRIEALGDNRTQNRGNEQRQVDRSIRCFSDEDDVPFKRFSTPGDDWTPNRGNERRQVDRCIRYSSDEDDVPFRRFSTLGDDWTPNREKEQRHADRSLRHSTLENDTPITRIEALGDNRTQNREKEQKYVDASLRKSTLEDDTPIRMIDTLSDDTPYRENEKRYVDRSLRNSIHECDTPNTRVRNQRQSEEGIFETPLADDYSYNKKKRRKRGPISLKAITPKNGEKHRCCLLDDGRVAGPGRRSLSNFLGILARNHYLFPIYKEWGPHHESAIQYVMKEIHRYFEFFNINGTKVTNSNDMVTFVKKTMNQQLRDFRADLKCKFNPHIPISRQLKTLDDRVPAEHWVLLAKLWNEQSKKVESGRNKKNRSTLQGGTYASGPISFAERYYNARNAGEDAPLFKSYFDGHKKKNGEYLNETIKKKCDKVAQMSIALGVQNTKDPLEFVSVIEEAHGYCHGGSSPGIGGGVTRRSLKKKRLVNASNVILEATIKSELQEKDREIEYLRAKLKLSESPQKSATPEYDRLEIDERVECEYLSHVQRMFNLDEEDKEHEEDDEYEEDDGYGEDEEDDM